MATKTIKVSTTVKTADLLAAEYLAIREAQAQLDARKEAVQSEVRTLMTDGTLQTNTGTFSLQLRRSLDWSLDAVKDIMGRNWTAFVKADAALLKERMKTVDEIGVALTATATVKEVEAFTFKEKRGV